MSEKIRVMIADDHAIERAGATRIINAESDMVVVGETADGLCVLDMARELKPDVLVLDISLPGISGMELVPELRAAVPSLQITLFSMHQREILLQQALEMGALGYVLKASAVEDLLAAIRAVHEGRYFLSPQLESAMIGSYLGKGPRRGAAGLSGRERQILYMVASGMTTRMIAEKLFLSPRTVEKHRASLMQKLGLKSVNELIHYAIREGIVPVSVSPRHGD